jgi:hypothetical protein
VSENVLDLLREFGVSLKCVEYRPVLERATWNTLSSLQAARLSDARNADPRWAVDPPTGNWILRHGFDSERCETILWEIETYKEVASKKLARMLDEMAGLLPAFVDENYRASKDTFSVMGRGGDIDAAIRDWRGKLLIWFEVLGVTHFSWRTPPEIEGTADLVSAVPVWVVYSRQHILERKAGYQ